MPKVEGDYTMTPISWTLLAVGLVLGGTGGFYTGRSFGSGGKDAAQAAQAAADAAKAAQGTAAAVAQNTEAITALTAAAQRPLVLDSETRAALASDIPAGCADPKASLTAACLVAQCWRFGQSAAQRPEGCGDLLKDARLQAWVEVCGKDENGKPDWKCIAAAQERVRK